MGDTGGEVKESGTVLPGEIGHAAQHPLFPKDVIGKGRNIAHMNASADDRSAFIRRLQGQGGRERPPERR